MDETFLGGEEPGLRGGRARGKKVLTDIAVEIREPKGLGRCPMAPVPDASALPLHAFVTDHLAPGSTVITDAWQGYRGIDKLGYVHDRRSQRAARVRGEDPGELLPAVHRIASLIKRWLLGTHQGSTDVAHLPAYMNEFVFRFNRRRSRSRGMIFYRALELAVHHRPGAVSRSDRQQAARQDAINAAERPRETSQSGAPASEPAMAGGRALLRLDG